MALGQGQQYVCGRRTFVLITWLLYMQICLSYQGRLVKGINWEKNCSRHDITEIFLMLALSTNQSISNVEVCFVDVRHRNPPENLKRPATNQLQTYSYKVFKCSQTWGAMVEHNLSSKNTGCILVRCKSTHPLRLLHRNNVRFVLTSSCLYECSCLTYVICVCLRIVVTNTYCVVFLLCFSSSCVQYRGGSAIEKNMIFWRKIVIFHTKYPKNVRPSLRSAQFF